MREIKFRAWDSLSEGFVTGDELAETVCRTAELDGGRAITLKGGIYDDRLELMQYTGLKDKNGVEVYEGDIIDDQGVTWYVEFGNGQYVLRCTCHYPDGDFYIFEDSPMYKVIGNIYENPELLNGNKE